MKIKYLSMTILSLFATTVCNADQQPLTQAELENTIGGVSVDISTLAPNQRIGRDDIEVRGTVSQVLYPGDITIVQDTGNGKSWSTTVATTPRPGDPDWEDGAWVSNFLYPLQAAPADFTVRICNESQGEGVNGVPCTLEPTGEANIANVDLNNSIRVRGIWFHNVQDGNQAASIPSATLQSYVQWIVNGNASTVGNKPFNMDELFGQCAANRRLQFRNFLIDNVDASNWVPLATDWTRLSTSGFVPAIPQQYRTHADTVDPAGDYLHVYIVNDITAGIVGVANSFSDNVLALEDSFVNGAAFNIGVRLLAHEIGHTQGLFHNSGNGVCNGTAGGDVMCPTINGGAGAGDNLTANQCTTTYNSGSGIDNLNL